MIMRKLKDFEKLDFYYARRGRWAVRSMVINKSVLRTHFVSHGTYPLDVPFA